MRLASTEDEERSSDDLVRVEQQQQHRPGRWRGVLGLEYDFESEGAEEITRKRARAACEELTRRRILSDSFESLIDANSPRNFEVEGAAEPIQVQDMKLILEVRPLPHPLPAPAVTRR
eukprot:762988-Hanusia_phi.AAC.2